MCENFHQFPAVGGRLGLGETRNRWSPATDADSTAKNTRQEPPMMTKSTAAAVACACWFRVPRGRCWEQVEVRVYKVLAQARHASKHNGNPTNQKSNMIFLDLSCNMSSCYSTMRASILSSGLLLVCIIGSVSSFLPGGSVRFVGNGGLLTRSQAFQAAGIDALSRKTELVEGAQQRRDTVR